MVDGLDVVARDARAAEPARGSDQAVALTATPVAATSHQASRCCARSSPGAARPTTATKTATPKVDDPDAKWQCDIPKAGSKETETKEIRDVGEFVKFCVEPAMKGRV